MVVALWCAALQWLYLLLEISSKLPNSEHIVVYRLHVQHHFIIKKLHYFKTCCGEIILLRIQNENVYKVIFEK